MHICIGFICWSIGHLLHFAFVNKFIHMEIVCKFFCTFSPFVAHYLLLWNYTFTCHVHVNVCVCVSLASIEFLRKCRKRPATDRTKYTQCVCVRTYIFKTEWRRIRVCTLCWMVRCCYEWTFVKTRSNKSSTIMSILYWYSGRKTKTEWNEEKWKKEDVY